MVESTGVFNDVELDCAVELADERLKQGPASGYHFVFAEQDGRVVGYACYGPIALTVGSYDLYWIAVDKSAQGLGLGRKIMDKVAEIIRGEGGGTSTSRPPPGRTTWPRGLLRALRLSAGGHAGRFLCAGRRQGDILQASVSRIAGVM